MGSKGIKETLKRFWSRVKRKGLDDCWTWTGAKSNGYGYFWVRGRLEVSHRFALELKLNRRLKEKEWSLHKCDNPSCVNPAHLFLGDRFSNVRDRDSKGRCARGQDHYTTHLTDLDVLEIRSRYQKGETQSKLANAFRIDGGAISHIVRGLSWKHVGGPRALKRRDSHAE